MREALRGRLMVAFGPFYHSTEEVHIAGYGAKQGACVTHQLHNMLEWLFHRILDVSGAILRAGMDTFCSFVEVAGN